MKDEPTFQDMVNTLAENTNINTSSNLIEYTEYAPKDNKGVIWWVYSSRDLELIKKSHPWKIVSRTVSISKSGWKEI